MAKNWFFMVSVLWLLCCSHSSMALADEAKGTLLDIVGVDGRIKSNIAAHLVMSEDYLPLSALGFVRSDAFIVKKVKEALQALGYYHTTVGLTGDSAKKTLKIELGRPTVWHELAVEVDASCHATSEVMALFNKMPMQKGQKLHHGDYSDYKVTIVNTAFAMGFLDAKFELSEFEVDIAAYQAKLKWRFNCSDRYTVAALNIEGSALTESFVKGYINLAPGQPYQQEAIVSSQQALNRTGLFNTVAITPQIDRKNKQVTLNIKVIDADKYQLKTRVAYATDIGAGVGISWQDLRVNSQGHHYTLSGAYSVPDRNIGLQYKIPLKKDKSEWLNQLSYRVKDEEFGVSKTTSLVTRYIQQHDTFWSSQWGLSLAAEKITSDTVLDDSLRYLVPFWQVNYYSVPDPFHAEEGWRWSAKITGTTSQLSQPDISFVQLQQQAKSVWQLEDNWRLMVRGKLGLTLADTETANRVMPSRFRFFAGGDVSVRGYEYQSLAPKDENDVLLGGKHILEASAEIDYRLNDDIRLAVFADAGNAFNNWRDWSVNRSIGTGIRWVTPVGSIRLDIAKALDLSRGWRLHITFGPDL